ncbi:MAG: hypothetical protein KDD53_01450 [Bdellovibrionales bacterium]|nr:hypothetical protein [Bdellovibrionales bacterium]
MKTNWTLIRKLMNSAIDACEAVETNGVTEDNRGDSFITDDGTLSATMWDYLQSSFTYPENLSYSVVRARHLLDSSKPYTNEAGRTLMAVGRLAAELVGAEDTDTRVSGVDPHRPNQEESLEEMITGLCNWYSDWMIPGVEKIMKRDEEG